MTGWNDVALGDAIVLPHDLNDDARDDYEGGLAGVPVTVTHICAGWGWQNDGRPVVLLTVEPHNADGEPPTYLAYAEGYHVAAFMDTPPTDIAHTEATGTNPWDVAVRAMREEAAAITEEADAMRVIT